MRTQISCLGLQINDDRSSEKIWAVSQHGRGSDLPNLARV